MSGNEPGDPVYGSEAGWPPKDLPTPAFFGEETKAVYLGKDLLSHVPNLLRDHFHGKEPLLVADSRTMHAAGNELLTILDSAGLAHLQPLVLEGVVRAEYATMERVAAALSDPSILPVAVGAGTLNDLTKLAAHLQNRPYACVATAASVDGYTAYGASLTRSGHKQMFPCPAPRLVLADTAILCQAPPGLNAAGYADLLAKIPAGADWILAEALGVESVDKEAWDLVHAGLDQALSAPGAVAQSDATAIESLARGLMASGLAMQKIRSSRPASGAEHQFSHLWDMLHHTHGGQLPLHGFKVGIGTLVSIALYNWILAYDWTRLDPVACAKLWPEDPTELPQLFRQGPAELADLANTELRAKWIPRRELQVQLETFQRIWPSLRLRLRALIPPLALVRSQLSEAGAPVQPETIGLSWDKVRSSVRPAYAIRRRFTILDLLVRTCLLDTAVQETAGWMR